MEPAAITSKIVGPGSQIQQTQSPSPASGPSFQQTLAKLVDEVDKLQHDADATVKGFAAGQVQNVHEVMIAMEKAQLSFKFMMEARNKLLDAYNEIMRMQV